MKRIIAALSLAALAAPAAASDSGAAFEQTQLDRQLPSIAVSRPADPYVVHGAPFEQNQLDRGVPLEDENLRFAAAGGGTVSDRSISEYAAGSGESPWANDHNMIAPAP